MMDDRFVMEGGHDPGSRERAIPWKEPPAGAADTLIEEILEALDQMDVPYVEHPGWRERVGGYYYEGGGAGGICVHHTAVANYSPKSCYPKPEGNRTDGRTNCAAMISEDGTIHLIGLIGNYTQGSGVRAHYDNYVSMGIRAPYDLQPEFDDNPDEYGNRLMYAIEVSHPGDGSPIPYAQEYSLAVFCGLLVRGKRDRTGDESWNQYRVTAHRQWSRRKIDPMWESNFGDYPSHRAIFALQDTVGEILGYDVPPPPDYDEPEPSPDPVQGEDDMLYPFYRTDGYNSPTPPGRSHKRDDVKVLQSRLNVLGANPHIDEDGKLGDSTVHAVEQVTGISVVNGVIGGDHGAVLERKVADLGGGTSAPPHTHPLPAGTTGENG